MQFLQCLCQIKDQLIESRVEALRELAAFPGTDLEVLDPHVRVRVEEVVR